MPEPRRDGGGGLSAPDVVARVLDGPTPKHAQLREILRQLIEHELPPGSAIPSERELAGRYRVSRLTVRSAIGRLVEEGLLTRARGKGTFTVTRRMEIQPYLMSFTSETRRRGLLPSTEVLDRASAVPPPATAAALRLADRRPAYRLARLRSANGVPLALERGWYHLPGLLELDTARLLGIRSGDPLLVFHRISSTRGEPVEDVTSWYRADRYQMSMRLDPTVPAEYGGAP